MTTASVTGVRLGAIQPLGRPSSAPSSAGRASDTGRRWSGGASAARRSRYSAAISAAPAVSAAWRHAQHRLPTGARLVSRRCRPRRHRRLGGRFGRSASARFGCSAGLPRRPAQEPAAAARRRRRLPRRPRRPSRHAPRRARSPFRRACPCSGCCAPRARGRPAASRKRATRSVGCAPTLSQCLARSASSTTRFSSSLASSGL